MPEYYDKLKEFGSVLKSECRSVWAEECLMIAICGVYADFEIYKVQNADPHILCTKSLVFWTEYLKRVRDVEQYYGLKKDAVAVDRDGVNIEKVHLELYGEVWPIFGKETLEGIKAIIHKRLKNNNLSHELFKDKDVIDFGCGGGRFSFVANELGAKKVLGIDFNEKNVDSANKWVKEDGLSGISFRVGTVYDCGEPDESYDVAISNGVFHIIKDPQAGYNECVRVLKDGGRLFLYVEARGGIINELQSTIVENIGHLPQRRALEILKLLGFTDNSIINLTDFFFAFYEYVSAEEIYNRLKRAGFAHIEELKAKGMDYDHGYYQRKNDSYSEHKYGEGQLRLVVTKGMSKEKRT